MQNKTLNQVLMVRHEHIGGLGGRPGQRVLSSGVYHISCMEGQPQQLRCAGPHARVWWTLPGCAAALVPPSSNTLPVQHAQDAIPTLQKEHTPV
jgi:hypothetical protein